MGYENLEQCERRIAELEAELSNSERRWRNVLEYVPQIAVSLDTRGRVVFANRHLLDLTGWTLDEVRGKSWFTTFLPEDLRDEIRELFLATMERKDVGPHSCHVNDIITRDGTRRTVSWFSVLSLDAEGALQDVTSLGIDLTAQEEAREAVQVSEERLKLALDAANDSVWDLNCETREVFVSPQLTTLLGYPPNTIDGTYQAWLELVHPNDRGPLDKALWGAVERRGAFEHEIRIKASDGNWKWVLNRGKVAESVGERSPVRMVGTLQDIHARKVAEEELRRAKMAADLANSALKVNMAHLRTLMETMPELVWVKDVGGVYLFCNHRFERLYGAKEAEIIGRTDFDFVDADLAEFFRGHDRAAMESGKPRVNEEQVTYRDDGHVEYLETIKTPLYDSDGKLIGVLGVARDITERKRILDKLKDSERRHRVIFENSPLGMIRIGREGRILDCNDRFVEMMGSSRDALIGFQMLGMNNRKMSRALATAVDGEPSAYEDYYASETGDREAYLHIQFNPVNPGHSPTEVIATLEDFSERKLDRDALQEAKEQAEAFSRSKTEFLTNMSHEIRTPLNGIMGMLQLMQATGLSEEQTEYTGAALQSTRRLLNLLTDILDLSRVEAGKLVMHNAPFDLVETCEQVCDLFKLTSTQSGVTLVCELGENVPRRVVGDAVRLQQVLTNLLGNAFKFTASGRIVMSAHRLPDTSPDGYRILFTVADTGVGIPDGMVDVLFDAFTQVSHGYTRQHQGAGLGLSICRNLVGLMGGTMAIESELGKGTTLYVSLPFGVGDEGGRAVDGVRGVPVARVRPLSILLAEDERVNSLVMKRILEKCGHSVVAVENGEQVLKVLPTAHFDVILMDIQMPVMDGVETARAIRAGEAGEEAARIPIVAVTAYAMVGDREKFIDAGMDGYVVKPIEREKLEQALARVCPGSVS
ncbi:PAS domain S-box protein [Desulfovibrio caledoniensis]